MSFLDKYQQGSFREVFFFTESHEFSGGRRAVSHEFPQRERSRTEDLGRKIRRFSIEMYVLEDRIGHDSGAVISVQSDYFVQRDALIEALETEGPGDLVHPYLGNIRAQVDTFTLSESKTEGRIAKFSVSFIEAGALVFPQLSESNTDDVNSSAQAVIDTEKTLFEQALDVIGFASFVAEQAAEDLEKQVDFFQDQISKVTGPISELTFALDSIKDQRDALVAQPAALASQIEITFSLLFDTIEDPTLVTEILAGFVSAGAALTGIEGTTPSSLRAQENQTAILNIFKRFAHSNEAISIASTEFKSVDSAVETRETLIDAINLQIEDEIDDNLYQDFRDLQSSLTRAVPSRDTGTLRTIQTQKSLPGIVLAHQIFLDLGKEDEILEQNKVKNPAFVPAGSGVEVTSG